MLVSVTAPAQFLPVILRDEVSTFESGNVPLAATGDLRVELEIGGGYTSYDTSMPINWVTSFTTDVAPPVETTLAMIGDDVAIPVDLIRSVALPGVVTPIETSSRN